MSIVTLRQVEHEREQLLQQWQRAFKRHPCWITDPPPQVTRVLSSNPQGHAMAVRKFHDKLGFCAKGGVETGGLCAGAIFRTASFITIPHLERSGARITQNAHIEHTVPVNVLSDKVGKQIIDNETSEIILAWLIKHSVTTAMRKGQDKDYLVGASRSTAAFDRNGPHEGLPFQRYQKLFNAGETVWDVWNRAEVDPNRLTFEDHWRTVLSLLRAAGAKKSFVDRLAVLMPSDTKPLAIEVARV